MMDDSKRPPTWRVREDLIRRAREAVEGRARFEKYLRPATKPLLIQVNPIDILQVLEQVNDVASNEAQAMDLWWTVTGDDWPVPEGLPAKFLTAALNGDES